MRATVPSCDLDVCVRWSSALCITQSLQRTHTHLTARVHPCSQYLFKSYLLFSCYSLKVANSLYFYCGPECFCGKIMLSNQRKWFKKIIGLLLGMALGVATFYSHWWRKVCERNYSPWDAAKTACVCVNFQRDQLECRWAEVQGHGDKCWVARPLKRQLYKGGKSF